MDLATGEGNIAPAKRGKRAQFLLYYDMVGMLSKVF